MTKAGDAKGWKLDRAEREQLLQRFPPAYDQTVADHVTIKPDSPELPGEVKAAIVGRTDDERGVEAMVVTIDGTVDRPDGSTYHITWSLGPGRKAKESNDVLKQRGWQELDHPVPVTLRPARI